MVGAEPTLTPVPTERGDYGGFYRGLATAIRHGGPVPVDPADAVDALELIERVHRDVQPR